MTGPDIPAPCDRCGAVARLTPCDDALLCLDCLDGVIHDDQETE